jgi:hypothetical protein
MHCKTARGLKKMLPCRCTVDFLVNILKHAIQKNVFLFKRHSKNQGGTSINEPTVFAAILFGAVFVC